MILYRKKCDDIQSQIDELYTKKEGLAMAYSEYAWRLAPIRRLPVEILGLVFVKLLELYDAPIYYHDFLQALFLTCRLWHRVALDTTAIWRKLALRADLFYNVTGRVTPSRVDAWVKRSKGLTLDVTLHEYYDSTDWAHDITLHNVLPLLQTLPRWEHLDCEEHSAPTVLSLFSDMESVSWAREHPFWSKYKSFDFQALTTLKLSRMSREQSLLGTIFAPRLTQLNLSECTLNPWDLEFLLCGSPLVSSLTLYGILWTERQVGDEDEEDRFFPVASLPRLTSFTYKSRSGPPNGTMCPMWCLGLLLRGAPSLQALKVCCGESLDAHQPERTLFSPGAPALHFSVVSVSRLVFIIDLEDLDISSLPLFTTGLPGFIRQFPSVKYLEIQILPDRYFKGKGEGYERGFTAEVKDLNISLHEAVSRMPNIEKLFVVDYPEESLQDLINNDRALSRLQFETLDHIELTPEPI